MSRTLSPSTHQLYGLARVAAAWGLPRSTYYARRDRRNHPAEPRRRGPKTPFTDAELTGRIRPEIAASPFTGEGHRKFWARLRVAGVRTSKARVLRLMREAQLLAPQRQAAPVARKAHTGTITTDRPNQMWGIDATATVTVGVLVQTGKGIGDNGIWRIGKLNGILYLLVVGSKTTSFSSAFAGIFASN